MQGHTWVPLRAQWTMPLTRWLCASAHHAWYTDVHVKRYKYPYITHNLCIAQRQASQAHQPRLLIQNKGSTLPLNHEDVIEG